MHNGDAPLKKLTAVYLILFFLFCTNGLFVIPVPAEYWLLPAMFAVSVISGCLRSGKTAFQTYALPAGILSAVCVFLLCVCVFPRIPSWNHGIREPALFLLAALTCAGIPCHRIFRVFALYKACSHISLLACSLSGIAESAVYLERSIIRSAFESVHPNVWSRSLLIFIVALYLGQCFRSCIPVMLMAAGLYVLCDSFTRTRTIALYCLLFIALLSAEALLKRIRVPERLSTPLFRVIDYAAIAAFPLNCVLWFGLIFSVPKAFPLTEAVNRMLANRIYLAYNALQANVITPSGIFFGGDWTWTDNGYTSVLLNYGTVGLTLLGLFWIAISIRFYRNGRRRILYAFALLAVYGGVESVLLEEVAAVFYYAGFSDLTPVTAAGEADTSQAPRAVRIRAAGLLPAFLFVLFLPRLFFRMRTYADLVIPDASLAASRLKALLSFGLVFALLWALYKLITAYLTSRRVPRYMPAVIACSLAVMLFDWVNAGRLIRANEAQAQETISRDADAVSAILTAKTGKLYTDPYPELYRKRFPGIRMSLLSGCHAASQENVTILTDLPPETGRVMTTQGLQFTRISDEHTVYTNDAPVIEALGQAGYTVTPYVGERMYLDLEDTAANSYLTYEPTMSGIFVDQPPEGRHPSETVWTNYNVLYAGTYEATFTCRLLMPEETAEDMHFHLGINVAHGGELAGMEITRADAGEDGMIVKTIPFQVSNPLNVTEVSFSVYGGNVRRLVVEEISYVQTG